jgi:hypothetical protein
VLICFELFWSVLLAFHLLVRRKWSVQPSFQLNRSGTIAFRVGFLIDKQMFETTSQIQIPCICLVIIPLTPIFVGLELHVWEQMLVIILIHWLHQN